MERKGKGLHQEPIRLNRFLAMAGVGSRRKNDALILSGEVAVNGRVVQELGLRVRPGKDRISVGGKPIGLAEKPVYILLNKPKDAISTMSDEKDRTTVMNFVRLKRRVFPIGRLDRNTTGVLLFTNDGDLANALIHPAREIEKIYRVTLDRQLNREDLGKLRKGVELSDGTARPRSVEVVEGSKRKKVLLSIHEGRNHEIKRLFEALGYDVRQLDRVSFAGLTPLGLARGSWRFLTRAEVDFLKDTAGIDDIKDPDESFL
jgi:pseudouridine synthase